MQFSALTGYCQLVTELPEGPFAKAGSPFHPDPTNSRILVTQDGFLELCRMLRTYGTDPVRWRGSYRELVMQLAVVNAAKSMDDIRMPDPSAEEASLSNLFVDRRMANEGEQLLAELKALTVNA